MLATGSVNLHSFPLLPIPPRKSQPRPWCWPSPNWALGLGPDWGSSPLNTPTSFLIPFWAEDCLCMEEGWNTVWQGRSSLGWCTSIYVYLRREWESHTASPFSTVVHGATLDSFLTASHRSRVPSLWDSFKIMVGRRPGQRNTELTAHTQTYS